MKLKDFVHKKKYAHIDQLKLGDQVIDIWGHKGVVVKIQNWEEHGELTVENHGTIYVWQSERMEHGADNCEHYSLYDWKKCLKLLYRQE